MYRVIHFMRVCIILNIFLNTKLPLIIAGKLLSASQHCSACIGHRQTMHKKSYTLKNKGSKAGFHSNSIEEPVLVPQRTFH